MKKRILSLVLTLVMLLGMLPTAAALAGDDIEVTFSFAYGDGFEFVPQKIQVRAGLAASYGIGQESAEPTVLDAIVAAHEIKYGEDFTAATADTYLDSSLTTVFQHEGYYAGHAINAGYSSDYASQAVLHSGDYVDTFVYEDSAWSDHFSYFTQDEEIIHSLNIQASDTVTGTVSGFNYMMNGTPQPLSGLTVSVLDTDGSVVTASAAVTDKDGSFDLTIDEVGDYLLAASGNANGSRVIPAWCMVHVAAAPTEEEAAAAVAADKEALNVAYTDGQDLELPTRGASGKTSITWSSSDESVISKSGVVTKQTEEKQVTLTAAIQCGTASGTREFPITVPALNDEELTQRLAAATSALNRLNALDPVEYSGGSGGMYSYESVAVDTNIVTKAQQVVSAAAPGVSVALSSSFSGNEYISTDGTITYPSGYTKGTVNDLQFVLTLGSKQENVSVSGIVIPTHDTTKAEAIAEKMAEVTETVILNGQKKEQVTGTLRLPVGSSYGLAITWTSDNAAITIDRGTSSSTGQLHTITRPVLGQPDASVTLTATFDYSDMAKNYGLCDAGPMPSGNTKTFTVTVPAYTQAEADAAKAALAEALETITADKITAYDAQTNTDTGAAADLANVVYDLHLYDFKSSDQYWKDGMRLSWSTTNSAITVNTLRAKVTRPVGGSDASGKLTVTATLNGVSASKDFEVTVKAVTAAEVMHNIAAKYAKNGIAGDSNYPWLAADLAAYAQAFPDTANTLTQEQIQAVLDKLISAADKASAPGDLAKYIIALRALGYDARKVVTDNARELDVVKKLTDLVDAQATSVSNPYTLPYVIIALQQGTGYATQAEMDWLIQKAIECKADWQNTQWGPDAATPMVLALSPYYNSNEQVKTAVDEALTAIAGTQSESGALAGYGGDSAASTGLAMAAYAAMGQTGPVKNGKNLSDGLMTLVDPTLDGFDAGGYGTFNTEQSFRGLAGMAKNGRVYDFAAMPMNTARATLATGCPVEFRVVPESASVVVKQGDEVQTANSGAKYYLAAGDYTYTVSKSGYVSASGSFTVSADDAAKHTAKTIPVSLAVQPAPEAKDISVSVKVLTHDGAVCGGKYTYKYNASAYTTVLAEETVTIKAGQSVFEALQQTLAADDVPYTEKSFGYIDSIGGISELDHNSANSGWLYMVNGVVVKAGCRDQKLQSNATVIWFFSDDYTSEYGSEEWSGGAAGTAGESGSAVIKPQATADSKGNATARVEEKAVAEALKQAGKDDSIDTIAVAPVIKGEAAKITVELPKTAVEDIAGSGGLKLTVDTPAAGVTISSQALAELAAQSGSTVSVSVETVKDETGGTNGEVRIDIAVDDVSVKSVSGGIAVTIPAASGNSGKVLALVREDGTEIILKKSVTEKDGSYKALLPGSAAVKLVTNDKVFSDVAGHWGEASIQFAASHELFSGTGGGRFSPDGEMSRAMLVAVLYRLEDAEAGEGLPFHDVPRDSWYSDPVSWAAATGIVSGTGNGAFEPEQYITREQLAAILFRYADHIGMDTGARGGLTGFQDSGKISGWASDAMKWAVGSGLMSGKGGGVIDPSGTASRAEVAAVCQRLITLMVQ